MGLPIYGIWLDRADISADSLSQTGAPPDIVVFTTPNGTTGSDAFRIAGEYGPKAFVREVTQQFRAKGF